MKNSVRSTIVTSSIMLHFLCPIIIVTSLVEPLPTSSSPCSNFGGNNTAEILCLRKLLTYHLTIKPLRQNDAPDVADGEDFAKRLKTLEDQVAELQRHHSVDFLTTTVNGSEYVYLSSYAEFNSWDLAERKCHAWGGNLVGVHSKEENDFIKALNTDYDWIWIGYSDILDEKSFRWADGSSYTYTNWADGYPSNEFAGKCVFMDRHGKWSDWQCSLRLPYVCRRKTAQKE